MRAKDLRNYVLSVGEIIEVLDCIPDSDRELIKDKLKEIESERDVNRNV